VAGYSYTGGYRDFALVRYNANGSLDTTFDGDGKVTTAIGTNGDYGYSVTVQPDGKILVAGSSDTDSLADFALVRYNADGSLDTTFDGDGKVTTAIGTGIDTGYSVVLQPDGKILVAGSCVGSNYDFALVRYNADGSLDTSFSGDGKVTTAIGTGIDTGYSGRPAAGRQDPGRWILCGQQLRLRPGALQRDGSLDESFDPKVNTLDGTAAFTEDCAAVVLDSSITIRDAELDALNGGLATTLAPASRSPAARAQRRRTCSRFAPVVLRSPCQAPICRPVVRPLPPMRWSMVR